MTNPGGSSPPLVARRIESALTPPRLGSYFPPLVTVEPNETQTEAAVRLYQWNAEIAAAMWPVMHVFEVVVRNAVSDVITAVHGPSWTHQHAFWNKLPNPRGVYSPRKDLIKQASQHPTPGKVIPELKMAFWERMFTSRHDNDFWSQHLQEGFPYIAAHTYQQGRNQLRAMYESVRRVRNRLGHHESVSDPTRFDLPKIHQNMMYVIGWRDPVVLSWVDSFQQVDATLERRP